MNAPQTNFERNQQSAHDQDEHDELRSLAFAHGLCLPAHGSSAPSAPSRGPYGTSTRRSIGRMPYSRGRDLSLCCLTRRRRVGTPMAPSRPRSTTKSARRLPIPPAAPRYEEGCVGAVSPDAPEGRHADGVGLPEEDAMSIR